MVRETNIRRNSRPLSHTLFEDEQHKAELEARNGLLQFDEVIKIISSVESGEIFKLRPSTIQRLHHIAIHDIYSCAGNYRNTAISIRGTDHKPPPWENVSRYIEELCDYINDNWDKVSPIHLSAYVMWKINWIHPFSGGNGRTSRAVSYLVLCAKLGYRLSGTYTIPDQIVENRDPYYDALDTADLAFSKGIIDVTKMEDLLSSLLAKQLSEIYKNANE